VPERAHGYSADDVARALVVVLRAGRRAPTAVASRLTRTYLAFLQHAQLPDGSFHNFMGYDRRFRDDRGSEDTVGRALWGLGAAVSGATLGTTRAHARQLFERAMHTPLEHPRAMGYSLLGLDGYLAAFPGADVARDRMAELAGDIMGRFDAHAREGWNWPADDMTYANAVIPHGVLRAAAALGDERALASGLEMLRFLSEASFRDGHFDAVGNDGWWHRDVHPAVFDQQPLEAGYMADACAYAWTLTGDALWADHARAAAAWFFGDNRLGACLFDVETGACFDGLTARGVNQNQGAESAIACGLALLAMADIEDAPVPSPEQAGAPHTTEARGDGASLRPPAVSPSREAQRSTDGEGLAPRS
jgi:hypothetical protein